jgi:hypothetical protein
MIAPGGAPAGGPGGAIASAVDAVSSLVVRARSEFVEMPGLRLTVAQASRLWALDRPTSERVLERLESAGFLWRGRDGAYLRVSHG